MAHHNTILSQIVALFPRHEFESLAKAHHVGQKFRSFNRWSQFLAMMIAQLSGRKSLRDLAANLQAQGRRFYHLGLRTTSRATLARVNECQPHDLYRDLFFSLLNRCQLYAPNNRFKFNGKIYLLDSTVINLCLSIFPWATFRKTKGAIKLHFGLDADGYLPVFMDMTKGKVHESTWAKALSLPKGSTVVFDRGFNDYSWYQSLTDNQIVFVTRLKSNAVFEPLEKRRGRKGQGICGDRRIRLKDMASDLRIVDFTDSTTGKTYRFLTNSFSLKANVIAELYKERWKIELFFKWIKQNLRVKTFLGSSPNAILTQLWIALCVYLLLTFLKFKARLGVSLTGILRLLQLNIFERRSLADLLKPPERCQPIISPQLLLWSKL
jgi:hypothetical protein